MDRRPSHASGDFDQRRQGPQREEPNVFDDQYAIDTPTEDRPSIAVADGFRPSQPTTTTTPQTSWLEDETREDSMRKTDQAADLPRSLPSIRQPEPRSSIQKPRIGRSSFTLANEGVNTPVPGRTTSTYSNASTARPHRAASSASSNVFSEHGQNPESFEGPSHPYGMYPQGTGVARSMSIATTSTEPQRSLSSSQRPTHPYGMYPQNVFADPDNEPNDVQDSIPLGFPGRHQNFHRQIGPDGEEQDIIGPDGHTEQLPPYSRYPDEGGVKSPVVAPAVAAVPTPTDTLDSPAAVRNQDPSIHSARSSRQTITPLNIEPLTTVDSSGSSDLSEKSWKDKTWKEKQKTKLWGRIPVWVLTVGIAMVVVLAVVIGAVVGGFVAKEKSESKTGPSVVYVTTTASMFDATVLSSIPTGLPSLLDGKYDLPLGIPEEQQRGCVANSDQYESWSCNSSPPPVNLIVEPAHAYPGMPYGAARLQPSEDMDVTPYGSQPPNIIRPQKLVLVADLDDPTRGPAYHFSATYDKIVVVDENSIPGSIKKRGTDFPNIKDGFKRHGIVQATDFPWMCFWNSTFIEGFIYVNQSTAAAAASARSSASLAALSSSILQSVTNSVPTPTSSFPSSIHVSENKDGSYSASLKVRDPSPTSQQNTPSTTTGLSSSTTTSSTPVYPQVVKIEERRLPNPSGSPYCQQMETGPNGNLRPIKDSNGNLNIVQIDENDPSSDQFTSDYPVATVTVKRMIKDRNASLRERIANRKRDDPPGSCHCQWVSS